MKNNVNTCNALRPRHRSRTPDKASSLENANLNRDRIHGATLTDFSKQLLDRVHDDIAKFKQSIHEEIDQKYSKYLGQMQELISITPKTVNELATRVTELTDKLDYLTNSMVKQQEMIDKLITMNAQQASHFQQQPGIFPVNQEVTTNACAVNSVNVNANKDEYFSHVDNACKSPCAKQKTSTPQVNEVNKSVSDFPPLPASCNKGGDATEAEFLSMDDANQCKSYDSVSQGYDRDVSVPLSAPSNGARPKKFRKRRNVKTQSSPTSEDDANDNEGTEDNWTLVARKSKAKRIKDAGSGALQTSSGTPTMPKVTATSKGTGKNQGTTGKNRQKNVNKIYIPPIVVLKEDKTFPEIRKIIQHYIGAEHCSFRSSRKDTLQVFCNTEDSFKALRKKIGESGELRIQMHQLRSEQSLKFIIRDVDTDYDIPSLTADVMRLGYRPEKLIRLTKMVTDKRSKEKVRVNLPLVLAIFKNEPQSNDFLQVTNIAGLRVSVERQRGSKKPTICFNCCKVGHSSLGCSAPPRCNLCTGTHQTRACTKNKETDPPECFRCHEAHPASYMKCKKFPKPVNKTQMSYATALKKRSTVPSTSKEDLALIRGLPAMSKQMTECFQQFKTMCIRMEQYSSNFTKLTKTS